MCHTAPHVEVVFVSHVLAPHAVTQGDHKEAPTEGGSKHSAKAACTTAVNKPHGEGPTNRQPPTAANRQQPPTANPHHPPTTNRC